MKKHTLIVLAFGASLLLAAAAWAESGDNYSRGYQSTPVKNSGGGNVKYKYVQGSAKSVPGPRSEPFDNSQKGCSSCGTPGGPKTNGK